MTTTPTRLLWLTDAYYPGRGGMARSCDRIVAGLRRSGIVVDVVYWSRRGLADHLEHKLGGVDLHIALGDDPAHAINRAFSVHQARWRARGYQSVVAFGGIHSIDAAPAFAAWLGLGLVTLLRGNDLDVALFSRRRSALYDALEGSRWIGAVTRDKVAKIKQLFPARRVEWTPNGIDVEQWPSVDRGTNPVLARLGPPAAGCRRIGLFGQLKAKKGVEFFLEVLHADVDYPCEVLLVGDRSEQLESWVRERTDLRLITSDFVDHTELPYWYAACDAVAIPSFYDGMPNVMLEAMAMGVPLLASRVDGMADVLLDGQHGFLFAPGDRHGCRRALARFLETPAAALAELGARARHRVARDFSALREAQRYRELFGEPQLRVAGEKEPEAALH